MPIKPIDYSTFIPKKSANNRIGSFKHSDTVWLSGAGQDEINARRQLLSSQLRRLFAISSQPSTTLAAQNNTFYLLTEAKNISNMPILSLLVNLLDLTISDEVAINHIRDYYIINKREANNPHALMNQILLKIIVTPPEVFTSFVHVCISAEQQQRLMKSLRDRQNILISYLAKENTKFKQFFMGNTAEQYVTSYHAVLERFCINEVTPIFNGYNKNEVDDIYANQKKKLSENGLCREDDLLNSDDTLALQQPVQNNLRLQVPDDSPSSGEIPWTDIGQPPADTPLNTPRTESSSPLSISSMLSRFGQYCSRSSSRLSNNSTPVPTGTHSPSRTLLSPVINLYKGIRGSSSRVAIESSSLTMPLLIAPEDPVHVDTSDLPDIDFSIQF